MKTIFLFHQIGIVGCATLITTAGPKTQSQAQAPSPIRSSVPPPTHSEVPSRGWVSLPFTAHSELINTAALPEAVVVSGTKSKSGRAEALTTEPSSSSKRPPSPLVIPRSGSSFKPSFKPSFSSSPSVTPSNKPWPSAMPSSKPTSKPSFSPSVMPSNQPSPPPSTIPSIKLSSKSSSSPSATPSNKPANSKTPSNKPSPSTMPSSTISSPSQKRSSNASPTPTPGPDPSKGSPAASSTDSGFLQGKTFVQKLYSLLTMAKYSSIISWNEAGTAVIIHDVDAFISKVVPAHFKKTKFGSFVRKMRRWGFSVFTKQRSTYISSTSSERGQSTIVEFSSAHFLRDQPELCLLMKDERNVKKQSSFVKKASDGGQNISQGSAAGAGVRVHSPPSASNMNATSYQPESQQQSEASSFAMMPNSNSTDTGRLNANVDYPHNYSQDYSMPPMISPHQHHQQSYYDTIPVMNMAMPQPPPPPLPLRHPYYGYDYGYGAPPPPHQAATGVGFGPPSPQFQYPAPDEYAPYPYQQQPHQEQMTMMQQNPQYTQQQQMMQQYHAQQQQQHPQQQQERYQYQQHPPPPAYYADHAASSSTRELTIDFAASINPDECECSDDVHASTANATNAAVLLTSSEESTERLPDISSKRQMS